MLKDGTGIIGENAEKDTDQEETAMTGGEAGAGAVSIAIEDIDESIGGALGAIQRRDMKIEGIDDHCRGH